MTFKYQNKEYRFKPRAIDPSVWAIERSDFVAEAAGSGSAAASYSAAIGFLATYVDDCLILSSDPVVEAATNVIRAQWEITDKPTVSFGSGASVDHISVNITANPPGTSSTRPCIRMTSLPNGA